VVDNRTYRRDDAWGFVLAPQITFVFNGTSLPERVCIRRAQAGSPRCPDADTRAPRVTMDWASHLTWGFGNVVGPDEGGHSLVVDVVRDATGWFR
jgi:hypothetical protein